MNEEQWITGKGRLKIAHREVDIELTVPAHNVSLKTMLPVLQFLTDTIVSVGIENAAEQGEGVSCTKGCGACCRQVVPISVTEAEAIQDLIENMPEPRQSILRERFAQAVEKMNQSGLAERFLSPTDSPKDALLTFGLEYFALALACPFLEEETCSIHENRPLACREYLVSSAPLHCQQPSSETVQCLEMPTHVSATLRTLSHAENESQYPAWLPLIQALNFKHRNANMNGLRSGREWVRLILSTLKGE